MITFRQLWLFGALIALPSCLCGLEALQHFCFVIGQSPLNSSHGSAKMTAVVPLAMNWVSVLRTGWALFVSAEYCGPEVKQDKTWSYKYLRRCRLPFSCAFLCPRLAMLSLPIE